MAASKPSKKQRGKLKAVSKSKKPEIGAASESSAVVATPKTHVKFDDNGEAMVPSTKKRSRAADSAAVKSKKSKKGKDEPAEQSEGGGKADRSPEMIQQARYYLEQWKRRDEPVPEGELPWKFKVCFADAQQLECQILTRLCVVPEQKIKQQWVLRWMYEADVVPKSMFSLVLEYLGGIQGAARKVSELLL
jgi:hypothetical protein